MSFIGYTEIDPTQTLPEEVQIESSDAELWVGELGYAWSDVLTVQAVQAESEEMMDMLDVVVRGVGMFVVEVDDALSIKKICQPYVSKPANAGEYDTAMPFSVAEGSGVQVTCSVNADGTAFLPAQLILVADACGFFMLQTDTSMWHRPLLRLSWGQLQSCTSSAEWNFTITVPSLGQLSFQCDTAPDELVALWKEHGTQGAGGSNALPAGWEEGWDEEGNMFYQQSGTDHWQWEHPEAAPGETPAVSAPVAEPEEPEVVEVDAKTRKKLLLEKRRQMKGKEKKKRVVKDILPKKKEDDTSGGRKQKKPVKKKKDAEDSDDEEEDPDVNPDFKYDKTSAIPRYRQRYLPKMRLKKKAADVGGSIWAMPTEKDHRKHFRCRQKGTKGDTFQRMPDFELIVEVKKVEVPKEPEAEGEAGEEGDAAEDEENGEE
jgi:hypothetical protein